MLNFTINRRNCKSTRSSNMNLTKLLCKQHKVRPLTFRHFVKETIRFDFVLVENGRESDNILFSYGYGASLPTAAKRRLQHSVHLARRVIQLEQANTSLRSELERERKKRNDLQNEVWTLSAIDIENSFVSIQLNNANQILDQAQQPYDFLISTVRNKEATIRQHQQNVELIEKQLRWNVNTRQCFSDTNLFFVSSSNRESEQERQSLIRTNNQLTKDIEKLLEYQEVRRWKLFNLMSHRSESFSRWKWWKTSFSIYNNKMAKCLTVDHLRLFGVNDVDRWLRRHINQDEQSPSLIRSIIISTIRRRPSSWISKHFGRVHNFHWFLRSRHRTAIPESIPTVQLGLNKESIVKSTKWPIANRCSAPSFCLFLFSGRKKNLSRKSTQQKKCFRIRNKALLMFCVRVVDRFSTNKCSSERTRNHVVESIGSTDSFIFFAANFLRETKDTFS